MEKLVLEMRYFLKNQRCLLTTLEVNSDDYRFAEDELKDAEYVIETVNSDVAETVKLERLRRVFDETISAEIYDALERFFPNECVAQVV